jgi:hypothetical protein
VSRIASHDMSYLPLPLPLPVVLGSLLLSSAALSQRSGAPLSASDVAAWREDLQTLGSELPRRHKNAFARMRREQWDSAVARLAGKLPQLRRHEVIVELMRLVAMVRDGHSALSPRRSS